MRFVILFIFLILPGFAHAQSEDDDRGFIVGLLERSLGGEGREVRIDGFAGALSREATIDQVTISDSQGAWLTLREVVMVWNRRALLRGAIDIESLTTRDIALARLPEPSPNALPSPEAKPFALPELPASISVAELRIGTLDLGAAVLGEAAQFTVSGATTLAGGAGQITLDTRRTDGPEGAITVEAAFDNATRVLGIDLDVNEAQNGLIGGLIGLPGNPSLALDLSGTGPLDDYAANLRLATDGTDQLVGGLSLRGTANGAQSFAADLAGDITPLFLPEYAAFFGPDVRLDIAGTRDADNGLDLDQFALQARAISLTGQVSLDPGGAPRRISVEGRIAKPSGGAVLLPLAGDEVRVDAATLDISFNRDAGDRVNAAFEIDGFERAGTVASDQLSLVFFGQISTADTKFERLEGRTDLSVRGLQLADAALNAAIGPVLQGGFDIAAAPNMPVTLDAIGFGSQTWSLRGNATIDAFAQDFATRFDTTLAASNLEVFSALTGQDLRGAAQLAANGDVSLGGFFDVELEGTTKGLTVGIAEVDRLIDGRADLSAVARRDTSGTYLEAFTLATTAVRATAKAELRSGASDVRYDVALTDAGLLTDAVSGPVRLTGRARQNGDDWTVETDIAGPLQSTVAMMAQVSPDLVQADVNAAIPDLAPLAPQLRGPLRLTASASGLNDTWQFSASGTGPADLDITGDYADGRVQAAFEAAISDIARYAPGLTGALQTTGTVTQTDAGWDLRTAVAGPYSSSGTVVAALNPGAVTLDYDIALANVAALVPGISGSARAQGRAVQEGNRYRINTRVDGPAGTAADVAGTVSSDGTLAVTAAGQTQLGLANRFLQPRNIAGLATFELAINGPPSLTSVSGRISTQGAQFATPALPVSFSNIDATVDLDNAVAQLDVFARAEAGGAIRVAGPLGLAAPNNANLNIGFEALQVIDPTLYATTLGGGLVIDGPLAGGARISGRIEVGETNVQVPASGISTFGAVPEINHIGATRPVMRTRTRAGLDQSATSETTTGPAFPLDVTINAPNRIFIRGRGLDAEVGGALRLTGTTADLISTGQFDLIRGRLNVLAKRFNLTEGQVQLQGRFEPDLLFVAETGISNGTARIVIEGPADEPEIRFESSPERPEDEVLAQVLFGRDVTQLSAFQAVQLANAVAVLAGRGGEGVLSRLRGSLGLDDLEVSQDEEGNTAVRAGAYISENVYTDVTVGGTEGPEVSLNIDLTPNLTVKGIAGSDGRTGVGVFLRKDY